MNEHALEVGVRETREVTPRYLLYHSTRSSTTNSDNITMKVTSSYLLAIALGTSFLQQASGYAFVVARKGQLVVQRQPASSSSRTALQMVDQNVIQGAAIAIAGLGAGIGLVAFTEAQGERAKQRGGGISDNMSTKLAGGLLEDVEVSSVEDLGSLTSQLEKALKESGGIKDESQIEMTEEEKQKILEEADDGW